MMHSEKVDPVEISVPYGRTRMTASVPARLLNGVYTSSVPAPAPDSAAEVVAAMEHPIGSQKLEELARGKKTAGIIASDHTRPVPRRILVPEMLRRLRAGAPEIDVTILVATGFHRATTAAELTAMFGA